MQTAYFTIPIVYETTETDLSILNKYVGRDFKVTVKQLKIQNKQLIDSKETLRVETFNQISKAFEFKLDMLKNEEINASLEKATARNTAL